MVPAEHDCDTAVSLPEEDVSSENSCDMMQILPRREGSESDCDIAAGLPDKEEGGGDILKTLPESVLDLETGDELDWATVGEIGCMKGWVTESITIFQCRVRI